MVQYSNAILDQTILFEQFCLVLCTTHTFTTCQLSTLHLEGIFSYGEFGDMYRRFSRRCRVSLSYSYSLIGKSLIQFQTKDNNLGSLVVVLRNNSIRYIHHWIKMLFFSNPFQESWCFIVTSMLLFLGKTFLFKNHILKNMYLVITLTNRPWWPSGLSQQIPKFK